MSKRGKILLVDDDYDVVEGIRVRLVSAGFEILAAYDGEEGVASAFLYHPDVIVLDVRMPKKDGLTALTELQDTEDTKLIPVVMLSASLADQRAALESGARFFLRKPYSGSMLIKAVSKAIEERGS